MQLITDEQYIELTDLLGQGVATPEQKEQIREYECAAEDAKYSRPHDETHLHPVTEHVIPDEQPEG